jgi:hypothetical protein
VTGASLCLCRLQAARIAAGSNDKRKDTAMHAPALPERTRASIDAEGIVEGYASLFGEVDQARDMVMPGAFAMTLKLRGVRRIPMLFQHDPAEPIGVWLDLHEDGRGLYARGRLIPDVTRAREVLALVRAGAIDGLSIGFRTASARVDPKTRIRKVTGVDLWEISIVTFPLLNGARVQAVKGGGKAMNAGAERRPLGAARGVRFSGPPYAATPDVLAPNALNPERLLRRHPRLSFARAAAERQWNALSAVP